MYKTAKPLCIRSDQLDEVLAQKQMSFEMFVENGMRQCWGEIIQ